MLQSIIGSIKLIHSFIYPETCVLKVFVWQRDSPLIHERMPRHLLQNLPVHLRIHCSMAILAQVVSLMGVELKSRPRLSRLTVADLFTQWYEFSSGR